MTTVALFGSVFWTVFTVISPFLHRRVQLELPQPQSRRRQHLGKMEIELETSIFCRCTFNDARDYSMGRVNLLRTITGLCCVVEWVNCTFVMPM